MRSADRRPGTLKPLSITRAGIAGSVGVLMVAAVCMRLGFWQLDRLDQRRGLNAAVAARVDLPPIAVTSPPSDTAGLPYRPVHVEGEYEAARTIVLAGRSHRGVPGVHLLTPLHLASGAGTVLVNRGWVPSPDAATVELAEFPPEPGRVRVNGLAMPYTGGEDRVARRAVGAGDVGGFRHVWYRLDRPGIASQFPYPLLELYVQALPAEASGGLPLRLPPPALDEGSHLSYAVQWFSFAGVFLIGWLILLLRRGAADPGQPAPAGNRVAPATTRPT
jgi:surfeit locus 1 family protein